MLIGLTGAARSGKDTVADLLQTHMEFTRYSFALPIKEACKQLFGWGEAHVNGYLKEVADPKFGVSPRKAMQTLGTEWGRECINENFWLLLADMRVKSARAEGQNVIVTDVRFENEAEFIRNNGGVVIHIKRPEAQQVRTHASEGGVSFGANDRYILNDGTLDDLALSVRQLMSSYKKAA